MIKDKQKNITVQTKNPYLIYKMFYKNINGEMKHINIMGKNMKRIFELQEIYMNALIRRGVTKLNYTKLTKVKGIGETYNINIPVNMKDYASQSESVSNIVHLPSNVREA